VENPDAGKIVLYIRSKRKVSKTSRTMSILAVSQGAEGALRGCRRCVNEEFHVSMYLVDGMMVG
jgi:hypothetical protein